jgi:hypothetical protein
MSRMVRSGGQWNSNLAPIIAQQWCEPGVTRLVKPEGGKELAVLSAVPQITTGVGGPEWTSPPRPDSPACLLAMAVGRFGGDWRAGESRATSPAIAKFTAETDWPAGGFQ